MKTLPLLLLVSLVYLNSYSQYQYTISGTVTDYASGEALIGATIYANSIKAGTITNNYGFYSLTLPDRDSLYLVFSFIGFQPQVKRMALQGNLIMNIKLQESDITLDEVVIEGARKDENIQSTQMGITDIPVKNIREIPVILGEADILKVVQLLPGVQAGNEGTTGYYVRGGNADQNLVQLDEAIVYNPNHLLGLFSTFNARALNNVSLIKGGFPSQYGGRLSSILDIQMKEGNNQTFHVDGGIGFITSNLTIEGPIKKDKASFIVSGRRTYIDLLIKPFMPKGNKSNYNFYDLNAKVNWKLSNKDKLFLSFFKGNDNAEYKVPQGINYNIKFGNSAATLRWNHLFGPKLFVNSSLIYNNYDQDISAIQDNFFSQTITGIKDLNAKTEFQYFPNPAHSIRFGIHYTNHEFVSGGISASQSVDNPGATVTKIPVKNFHEVALYINDDIKINNRLSTNYGLRLAGFYKNKVSYNRLEPRASIKYSLNNSSSVKAAYTVMNQFLHLIPSSTATIPTDVWIPSSARTKPQQSVQYAIGYFRNYKNHTVETSLEAYYKEMDNQVLFPEGNQLIENFDVDTSLVYGKGWSYGIEYFLKKNSGRLTGWLAYTLSWTNQKFELLNFGKKFPFRYDRRHVLSVVGSYKLNSRWTLSGAFVYNTGSVYTLPVGRFNTNYGPSLFEGNYFIYEERNNTRMKAFHRLDVSATYKKTGMIFGKPFSSEIVFSLYNAYNRLNPYFVYLKIDPTTDQPLAKQVSLLPVIPSVSYNFKF